MRRGEPRAVRHDDRLVIAAAGDVCTPGHAVRGDAHRLQMDRAGRYRRAASASTGTRRRSGTASTPTTYGTRTASPPHCSSPSSPPGSRPELRTLADRLDELAAEFGVYVTDQLSVRVDDLADIGALMAHIRHHPPATLLDAPVESVTDLLPDNDVLTLRTAPLGWSSARAVPSPSSRRTWKSSNRSWTSDVRRRPANAGGGGLGATRGDRRRPRSCS